MVNLKKLIKVTGILLVFVFMMQGCWNTGDTSGFKQEKQLSKEEIQKQIELVKNNPNMPNIAKGMALQNLNQKLANAK